jgi:S-DNA-T family DNA segregation ATPase FtsK/SpoIIIE
MTTHYGRFLADFVGILLLFLSGLTVFALLGLTRGNLLLAIAELLQGWFGWGALPVDISLGVIGVFLLRRKGNFWSNYFWKIVYFELLLVSLLAVLSMLSANDIGEAQAGQWGGLVGWGLSQGLADLLGGFLSGSFWLLFCALLIWIGISAFRNRKHPTTEIPPVPQAGRETSDDFGGTSREFERTTQGLSKRETAAARYQARLSQQEMPSTSEQRESAAKPVITMARPPVKATLPADQTGQDSDNPVVENLGELPETQHKQKPLASNVSRPRNLPPADLLMDDQVITLDEANINQAAAILEKTLDDFGIPVKVVGYRQGPSVTQFAVEPGFVDRIGPNGQVVQQKVRVAQIAQLSRDLALALSATSIRIEAPVAGKTYVGVEIPNVRSVVVRLKALLTSDKFLNLKSPLSLALGRDVSGMPVVGDLSRMPHLLIAGTTNSGKTVCVTALASCLVMNNPPEALRLVMIDPKMVELVRFNGLPHMLGQVETEIERIIGVLRWATQEMDRRYIEFAAIGARDLDVYNHKMQKQGNPILPRIVVIIDELADLMMNAQASVEPLIVRLTQLARATGIHLIVATQRPSRNVLTGIIKSNIPARISFAVASHVDSQVILDSVGAESLLGRGDMLFKNSDQTKPIRTQGVMVNDDEIKRIVAYWQQEQGTPVQQSAPWDNMIFEEQENGGGDDLIEQAIQIIKESRQASASLIQQRLRIGYPRAARIIDELEKMGVVGPARSGGKQRDVLIDLDEDEQN